MASDRLYLVFSFAHHPGPIYLHRTAEVSDGTRGVAPIVKPVFDDDIALSHVWNAAEFVVQARYHWRGRGYRVGIYDQEGAARCLKKTRRPKPSQLSAVRKR